MRQLNKFYSQSDNSKTVLKIYNAIQLLYYTTSLTLKNKKNIIT